MRIAQPKGTKGSLKWIQKAVNERPKVLLPAGFKPIEWRSPLEGDEYAEYRDASFLDCIGHLNLSVPLSEFWPSRGPQWDALGQQGDKVILVEAKAHISEFLSPPSQAKQVSMTRISSVLSRLQRDLGAKPEPKWGALYYQYLNRLAHLYFLREHGVDAHLLFVGFLNDPDMNGPQTPAEWQVAYQSADYALGLSGRHPLSRYVHHVYPDVRELL